MSEVEEKVHFERGAVLVTNARFVNGVQTFAMRNVSAVEKTSAEPSWGAPIVFGLLGLFALSQVAIVGIVIIAATGGWVYYMSTKYRVILTASGSVQTALESRDEILINQVVAALNKAIIERG